MKKNLIIHVSGREILDSRGNPTVEACVTLQDGSVGVACVPSGASTGKFEACELRDKRSERYGGKGVLDAVSHVNGEIADALQNCCPYEQEDIDRRMIELDGTANKGKMGANAILAVSLAVCRAAAHSLSMPLYRYIGGSMAVRLPVPMMNIMNGGAHAANNLDIQEMMIVPVEAETFSDGVRMCSEIYHALGDVLKSEKKSTTVGDEGGYAPALDSDEEGLTLICRAIKQAGYTTEQVKLALDVAASEWKTERGYYLPKRVLTLKTEELIDRLAAMAEAFPIISIEDGLGEEDYEGWKTLTKRMGHKMMLVGDDLFVTNTERLQSGIRRGIGNAILIKPNQIGTVTETLEVIRLAQRAGYAHILSHRSGETEDTSIADFAVGSCAPYIKTGAPCRSERVAKYNRLMKIERMLHASAAYGN